MKKQEIGKTEFFQSRYFPLESFIRKNFSTLSHRILQMKQGIQKTSKQLLSLLSPFWLKALNFTKKDTPPKDNSWNFLQYYHHMFLKKLQTTAWRLNSRDCFSEDKRKNVKNKIKKAFQMKKLSSRILISYLSCMLQFLQFS